MNKVDEEDKKLLDGKTQSQFGIELGQPWLVGKDVADILGYQNGTFGNRGVIIINESGLYSLILSSKLPQADAA